MRTIRKKISFFLLCLVLIWPLSSVETAAAFRIPGTCQIQADDGAAAAVKTLDCDYANNTYFSLREIGRAHV